MQGIRRVGIALKPNSKEAIRVLNYLVNILKKYNIKYVIDSKSVNKSLNLNKMPLEKMDVDIIISIGGDGTLLYTIHRVLEKEIPILGINIEGSFGFLNEGTINEVEESIKKLVEGDYEITSVNMIKCIVNNREFNAINEIVISKELYKAVKLSIKIDGQLIYYGKMDGIIIATPLGSTAYTYSAGGPIIEHGLNVFVITPLCPVRAFARPIVISDKHIITVEVINNRAIISGDCFFFDTLKNDKAIIMRSEQKVNLIKISKLGYFEKIAKFMNFVQEY